MKNELDYDFERLKTYPKSVKANLLKVFNLINTEIYLIPDTGDYDEIMKMRITGKKFYNEKMDNDDIVSLLDLLRYDFVCVDSWKLMPKMEYNGVNLEEGFSIALYSEKFIRFGKSLKKAIELPKEEGQNDLQENFEIKVKDREIWINDYLLSKPHAVGSNLGFFEYVCLQPINTKIERKNLPSKCGDASLQEEVKSKGFIKILCELGFKGEILKVFFPKRGKDVLVYRGDKITKEDLEKIGINIPLFIKELELAHMKNSPK